MGYRYTAMLMGGGATPAQKSTRKKEPSSSADMSKKKRNDKAKKSDAPKKTTSLGSTFSPLTTANASITKTPTLANEPKKRKPKDDATKSERKRKPKDDATKSEKKRKPKDDATKSEKKRKLKDDATQSEKKRKPKDDAAKSEKKRKVDSATTEASASTTIPNHPSTSTVYTPKPPPPPPLPLLHDTYTLTRVLKGHAFDNESKASSLWACEFEPKKKNIVAIGGSNNILFLDVQLGRYIKKYTHIEPNEEFLCLAWTVLQGPVDLLDENAADNASCNILAAAGLLGSIKLFNTLQNECYRYLFGHQKQVRKLQFCKSKPRWLFSASDDLTVRLWDIGAPNTEHSENAASCLAKFTLPGSEPTALSLAPDLSSLVVGCALGELVQYNMKPKEIRSLEKSDGHTKHFKHTSVFPSGGEWHEGYVDDVYVLGQQKQGTHALDGCIVSRGSDDYETLVWRPKTSTKQDADIAISLEWPDSADHAGLRFKVVEKHGDKVVVAGDYEGQIRIFSIGEGKSSRTLDDGTKEVFGAEKVLSHGLSCGLVRDLCVSQDTQNIIAVDSMNSVFVWSSNGK